MKRLFDIVVAIAGLAVFSPLLLVVGTLIWLQDFKSPFYRGERVGLDGRPFRMLKFRSMVVRADRTGVRSTAGDDRRITRIGHLVRRFKLDELTQLWNVLIGEMSLVGPRPNVPTEVGLYSQTERGLLAVPPGITDFASIVFSDEGDILKGSKDPDRDYNLLIRPWKSQLGLHYIAVRSAWLDARLILLTAVAIVSRPRALRVLQQVLVRSGALPELVRIAGRGERLRPTLPPGVAEADWEKHLTYA